MKTFDLLENMGYLDDNVIMEANQLEKVVLRKRRKSPRLLALVAVLSVLLLGVTAYAAMDYMGIFAMLQGTPFELAPGSAQYVESQEIVKNTQEGWSCQIVESLVDAADYTVTVGVSGGEKYIVAPTYCSPGDSVFEIGMDGPQTLEELAREQGKTLLFVGAGMEERERLGIAVETEMYRSQTPSEMTILITGQKLDNSPVINTSVGVYAMEEGKYENDDVQRLSLPVTMTSAPLEESFQMAVTGSGEAMGIKILSCNVFKSALGWMVEFKADLTELDDDFKKMDCDELTSFEGGGFVLWENSPSVCQWTKGQGEITDTLTVHFYNWDNKVVDTLVFKKCE